MYQYHAIPKFIYKISFILISLIVLSACQNQKPQYITDSIDKKWVIQQHNLGLDSCNGIPSLANIDASDLMALPPLAHHVNDATEILKPDEVNKLDRYLYDYERKTGSQLVVFIVPTLKGEGMFSYAQRIACKYRLGRKQIGDGVFLVIAMQDQQYYLYLMSAVSPFISDEKAKQITSEVLTPALKKRQFYEGIKQTMEHVMLLTDGKFPPPN